MPTEVQAAPTPLIEAAPTISIRELLNRAPLIVGFVVLLIPTLQSLGAQVWTRESGAHGPIIAFTGAWLIWRRVGSLRALAEPGSVLVSSAAFIASLLIYVFGRMFDFISIEAAGLYLAGLSIMLGLVGPRALLANWFPFFYLGFLVPPPDWVLAVVTGPLKQLVSGAATGLLHAVGMPIAREGVTIYVAQYELLVEDACSGMNSLTGLIAISLLYIYLLRGSAVRYSLVLTALVIPIAVVVNIVRIITLILLTYYFGDEVAQGFAHFAAGIFLFAIALVMVFLVDSLLSRVLPKAWRPE